MLAQDRPPRTVSIAVSLLVVALILGAARSFVLGIAIPELMLVILSIALPFLLLGGFLILMVYQGRNWARVTFTVLFFVGIILNAGNVVVWFFVSLPALVIYFTELALTLVALVYIFQDKASIWFTRRRTLA